jgi:hypothetical protein
MDNRKFEADAIASPPAAPVSPSAGYPTNGDPSSGQNATEPGAWWFHSIGEEIRTVIEAAGLTPDHADLTQLSAAIDALIAANIVTVPDASETVKGIGEIANDAEAQAFTANKLIDGAKLETALKGANQSLAASGYQKLPGGLIIQWGQDAATPNGTVNVTFPIAFPTAVKFTQASYTQDMGISGTDVISTTTRSTTGMTLRTATNEAGTPAYNWLAIGY